MDKNKDFKASMTTNEKRALQAFVDVVKNFLGNRKTDNYMEIVNELFAFLEIHGCNMSIRVHFLFSYLDKLSKNLVDVSYKQGECFQQDIKVMK